jgi:hypothetical protein
LRGVARVVCQEHGKELEGVKQVGHQCTSSSVLAGGVWNTKTPVLTATR